MATDVVIAVGTRGIGAAARSITRLEDRSTKFGRAMATTVAGGAIIAGVAVTKFAVASVRAASKSQQSIGATETVYGRYARTVIRESKRADEALGLSANEYRELANVSGAMLKASGIPLREVTGLTAKLEQRAADVAATFGGSTREAVQAFNAVLRGETDPVERYGVSIKQVDVNARLAAKGQDKLTGAAGKQAGAMARLGLLFDQTRASSGQFARESDTLAGAQQRLDAKVENLQARFGKLLLPVLTEGVNLISRKVIPAAEDLAGWLEANQDEIEGLAGSIADGLLPPLQTLGGLAASAARLVSGLPPEVQSLAAQAALAALVIPRLSAALDGLQLRQTISDMASTETRVAALGRAARTAAGIGGVLALTQGATAADSAMQDMAIIGGGALLGFSVGGPIGAAVGGLGAGVWRLYDALTATSPKFEEAAAAAIDYKSTLDETTGAVTGLTRAAIVQGLQQDGIIASARNLGLTTRDLVGAVLGQTSAIKRVNKAYTDQDYLLDALQANDIKGWIYDQGIELNKTKRAAEAAASGYTSWNKVLKGIPREVRVQLRNVDYKPTLAQWRELNRTVDLTPKQKQIIIKAIGFDPTIKSARNTNDELGKVGKQRANLKPWLAGLTSGLSDAQITARSGSSRAGNDLGAGLYGGLDSWAGPIASRAASIVRAAIAAARAAADAHSPSLETMRLGKDMGDGLAIGMTRSRRVVEAASFGIVDALVAGLTGTDTSSPVDGAIDGVVSKIEELYDRRLDQATGVIGKKFDRLGKQVEARFAANERRLRKQLKGKAEDKALRRSDAREERAENALAQAQRLAERRVTKQIRAERASALNIVKSMAPLLQKNAIAQATINAQLEEAKTTLAQLREQHAAYVAQVRDNVVSFGSIIGLGEGEGFGSVDQMLAKLRAKVADARNYADLIKSLTAAGLNQTTIQQLIDAGVEGGIGTAQAIASGGSAAIREINDLTKQLTDVGTDLGTTMADTLKSEYNAAGLAGAEGLVSGLASQAEAVAAEGRALAARLDQALAEATALTARKNLDSGRAVGRNLVAGLLEGIEGNEAAVDRAAHRLGNALVRAVKAELGIRSPSSVFRGIGDNVIKGLDIGLDDTYVKRSAADLAASLQKGFATPRVEALLSMGTGGMAAPVQITVQVPPTADKAAIGREIKQALDAYSNAGGR